MAHNGKLALEQSRAMVTGVTWRRVLSPTHRGSMRVLPRDEADVECVPPEPVPPTPPAVVAPVVLAPTPPVDRPPAPQAAQPRLRPGPRTTADCATGISARPAAPEPRALPPYAHLHPADALQTARQEVASQAGRIGELECLLRVALEDLGRKSTDVRNLAGRVKDLEPLVERVRARDTRLDEAHAELRRVRVERDGERLRRAAADDAIATLRTEIDWRDYVIRDLESMPDQLRASERLVAELRDELSECRAEIASLRWKADRATATDGPHDAPTR